jgi:hypothetical protein
MGTHANDRRVVGRRRLLLTAAVLAVALIDGGVGLTGRDLRGSTARAEAADLGVAAVSAGELQSADAAAPAARSKVRAVLPSSKLPPELAATISAMVSPADGCTNTVLGSSVVSAAHCRQPGFSTDGDIAWTGPAPLWADPSRIPIGATLYAVGYPQAAPGPQEFTLSNLGSRTIMIEQRPQLVLMTVGDGVPCTQGASGMVGWVTLDGEMLPIGPLSVFSTEPAITGLPAGQYVCGFAISAAEG